MGIAFVAAFVGTIAAGCSSQKTTGSSADSTKMTDSTSTMSTDTTMKPDTAKMDTTRTDTTKTPPKM